ncbi:unnamed protein product [Rotaria socialis]|uniref:Uncharacterized protein n=1 Tax=Rotaria socialis TaxID=392032 RepID=A0A820ZZT6_9BILA|nr:unnamed protein product [Rotaria socialis]CAF4572832.1 unnamed protein product [Rotaria socialis]
MPVGGSVHGPQYIPTPVHIHGNHESTFAEVRREMLGQRTTSQTVSETPPSQLGQRPITTSNANTNSKATSSLKSTAAKAGWTTTKKIIVGVIIGSVAVVAIIIAIVVGVLVSRKSASTATATTTQATSVTIAYWSFDAITTDLYNVYNGILVNSASYFSNTINSPYVGNGRGLSLTSSSNQYFTVSSPFLDLSNKSFTIEAWIYPIIGSTVDFGIFGQCQCGSCSNQCLYFIIRSYNLYVSFMNNDLSGSITLSNSVWYHVAFVYNYDKKQQILYVNGVQDTIKSNANAYQGANGSLLIGAAQVYLTTSYFNGYIDNFKISTTAKSATDILSLASVTAYFSFDLLNPSNDNGPLGLNGTAVNTAIISGRVNEAMRFSGSSSYFYAYGFYQIGYGVLANKPFSISFWINPTAIASCAVIQTTQSATSSGCYNVIGFYSATGSAMQIIVQGYAWYSMYGPFITTNTWTHISTTYSQTNGLRLYVNGALFGNTGTFTSSSSGRIMYLQLGYNYVCSSSSITNSAFQGSMDEVYVHNREITQSEITALANP